MDEYSTNREKNLLKRCAFTLQEYNIINIKQYVRILTSIDEMVKWNIKYYNIQRFNEATIWK